LKAETLLWLTGIRDEYILKAVDEIPDASKYIKDEDMKAHHAGRLEVHNKKWRLEKNWKGEVLMYIGIGLGTAAVIAAACLGITWKFNEETPVKEPMTLEAATEEETAAATEEIKENNILGLEADERLVVSTSDEMDVVIDGNLNIVAELPEVDRYYEAVKDWTMYDYLGFDGDLDREKMNRFVVKDDAILICGGDTLGLYSLAEMKWMVEPAYKWIFPLNNGRYLAQHYTETEEGTTIYAKLIDKEGTILYEWDGLSQCMQIEEGKYLIAGEMIYDLNGTPIYPLHEYTLTGIKQDIALIANEGKSRFVNLKTMETIGDVDYYADLQSVTSLHDCLWSVTDADGSQCIFDIRSEMFITAEWFIQHNQLNISASEIYVLVDSNETEEWLVRLNTGDEEVTFYVCDRAWKVKRSYENVTEYLQDGCSGILKSDDKYEIVNFWTEERTDMIKGISGDKVDRVSVPAEGWLLLKDTDEIGIGQDTLILHGQVIAENIYWIEQRKDVFECTRWMDSGERVKEYYSMTGKKLNDSINPDEISYLGTNEVVVVRDGICIFLDWDGNELGRCIAE